MTLFTATILHLAPFLTAQKHPASLSLRAFSFPFFHDRVDHGTCNANQIASMCFPRLPTQCYHTASVSVVLIVLILSLSFTCHELEKKGIYL